MYTRGEGYDKTYSKVKGVHGIANPNMGFACQLLQVLPELSLVGPQPLVIKPEVAHAATRTGPQPRG